jgi:hypothetical protein
MIKQKKIIYHLLFFIISISFIHCGDNTGISKEEYTKLASNPEFLHRSVKQVTDIIVHNTFSPPVASRIYAYSSIAAYEVMRQSKPQEYETLAGQVKDLKPFPSISDSKTCIPMAAVFAYLNTGKNYIFTEDSILAFQSRLETEYKELGVPKSVIKASKTYGEMVSKHILEWSKKDMYAQTRTHPKYDFLAADTKKGEWIPTPPDRMDGIEPHWREIRPLIIKTANQFAPTPPTAYDTTKNSLFYTQALEVYKNGRKYEDTEIENLSANVKENIAIAEFWDCNPYVSHHGGHAMFATKKITPGGHWVNITAIAARKAKSDMVETSEAYVLTCIALFDGFISCWDEKYRSNLVRPVTFITEYIDKNWQPLLQTPPFPEYTSGHSVISSAASVALTSIYGDNFAFDDTSEEEYGLPTRSFSSFYDASAEAAISRHYGGIHYMPAITNGVSQGKNVGNYVIRNLKLRKNR